MIPYEIVVAILFTPVIIALIAALIYANKMERTNLGLGRRNDHDR